MTDKKTILVVDDEAGIRQAIVYTLENESFEIVEADNGSTALELAKSVRPHLIISDIKMDNGTGFMLKELLREDEETASIPIILMTGAAQSVGAWGSDPDVGYLEKPFRAEELLKAIRRALE